MTHTRRTGLSLTVDALNIRLRIGLEPERNPELVDAVAGQLPLTSPMGHVVVSGEGIWLPSRLVYLGEPRMVQRQKGSVYINAPGQSICMTYGHVTETAVVNQFGMVSEEDFDALEKLGQAVWKMTVEQPRRVSVVARLEWLAA
ncbi:cyclophilin-like fold protein [Martelella sp. HB161492]|uniref:cyclophilin-like fold protein n=1 Tax=Martelella sp. HB161492 TaxID=2720726 RepID=UPI00159151F1|nr:cyclophilin-like fold protein [Martelella sp. HB161492]